VAQGAHGLEARLRPEAPAADVADAPAERQANETTPVAPSALAPRLVALAPPVARVFFVRLVTRARVW
jgi:hypothetical protein